MVPVNLLSEGLYMAKHERRKGNRNNRQFAFQLKTIDEE